MSTFSRKNRTIFTIPNYYDLPLRLFFLFTLVRALGRWAGNRSEITENMNTII
jgi:hypothetical protein